MPIKAHNKSYTLGMRELEMVWVSQGNEVQLEVIWCSIIRLNSWKLSSPRHTFLWRKEDILVGLIIFNLCY